MLLNVKIIDKRRQKCPRKMSSSEKYIIYRYSKQICILKSFVSIKAMRVHIEIRAQVVVFEEIIIPVLRSTQSRFYDSYRTNVMFNI